MDKKKKIAKSHWEASPSLSGFFVSRTPKHNVPTITVSDVDRGNTHINVSRLYCTVILIIINNNWLSVLLPVYS